MPSWFRHTDRRYPFLWETTEQPAARWHGADEGPAHYLASTPDGAWAEFLRHEEITDPADLAGVERALWAIRVQLDAEVIAEPELPPAILTGGLDTYPSCQKEALRLRTDGATALRTTSAALYPGGARGQKVDGGLVDAEDEDGKVLVLFGPRPVVRGWSCVEDGRPSTRLLPLVRPLA